jgi:NlpE N-terminal domain
MKTPLLAAILVAVALTGCVHADKVQTRFDPPYPERNANGDPILAVYEGRTPCATEDCEKLKIGLVLYRNQDTKAPTTYWLGLISGGKANVRTVTQGTWTISRGAQDYPEAVVYALDANTDPELRYYWRVNEDILLVLDQRMRPKVGDAAWGYMLSRYAEPYGPRIYRYDQRTRRFVGSAKSE